MSGKFTIEIELGNSEMCTAGHVQEAILKKFATLDEDYMFEYTPLSGVFRDTNGNVVGRWAYEPGEDPGSECPECGNFIPTVKGDPDPSHHRSWCSSFDK